MELSITLALVGLALVTPFVPILLVRRGGASDYWLGVVVGVVETAILFALWSRLA